MLRSPQLQKKRSPDYFTLVAPVTKTFGRARRTNFGRWSFLLRSRQSLKRFRQRPDVLLLNQSKQNPGRLTLVLRPRQSQKLSVAPGTKKKRSVVTSISLALVRKKIGRWTLLLQSCQSQNAKVVIRARRETLMSAVTRTSFTSVAVKLLSADTFDTFALFVKTFGRARRETLPLAVTRASVT